MNRVFIVTGGESTGTRMMTRAFVLAGVPEWVIDYDVGWPYGHLPPFPAGDCVLHIGMPIGGKWLNLWEVTKRLRNENRLPVPVVMTREWHSVARSQIKRGYVNTIADAENNLRAAYRNITQQLSDFIFVSYEQFCLQSQYRKRLFVDRWELSESEIDIHYANDQYYD